MNIEKAKERFKKIVDFYKLNDPNNYDYDDRDLISMRLVLEEIERLNNIINRTTKYVESLSSSGRGCDIYDDIKQDILKALKGDDKE